MKKEKSCGCIIIKDNKVLLVKGGSFWGFPKGHIEENETELQTALRETKEEVGLDVKIDEDKRYEVRYIVNDRNIDKTVILFLATPINTEVKKQDEEISETMWCEFNNVLNVLSFEEWRKCWKKAYLDIIK